MAVTRIVRISPILAVACSWVAAPVLAVCLEGHPTPEQEFRKSAAVVVGRVLSQKETPPPKSLNGWYEGTTYSIEVREIVHGSVPKQLSLFSENSTGRFPMRTGSTYLLFLYEQDSVLMVDNCGNSNKLEKARSILTAVRKLK